VSRITHHALRFTLLLALTALLALPTAPQHVTLAFLGDVMLGRGVIPTADTFAFLTPYLSSADLALANLESPLSTNPSEFQPASFDLQPSTLNLQPSTLNLRPSTFNFRPSTFDLQPYYLCAPSDRAALLATWGLDLVSIANNHSLDCGEGGLDATRSTLHASGLTPLDPQPVYRTINGLELAFLAFNDVSVPLDVNTATQVIREAHDTGALVIVSIHWGAEYQGGASERQRQLAQQFVDAGAILIWGHHPHVLQPAEWFNDGKTLILYSLGNALFDQGGLADTRQSALVLVELGENGLRSAHAIPFEIDIQHSRVQATDEQVAGVILERLRLK